MRESTKGNTVTSCKSSINYLFPIRIGKAGGLFIFLKPSCSSNSEGVGKPFLLKKGWKQKHKSANIEKQCQMVIFCLFVFFLFFWCVIRFHTIQQQVKGLKTGDGNTKWQTLINGLNEDEWSDGDDIGIKKCHYYSFKLLNNVLFNT